MTEPRKDVRKRDRAAYMREYRAKLRRERPALQAQVDDLNARVAALEAMIAKLPHRQTFVVNDELHVMPAAVLAEAARFGRPRPAPKGK